MARQPIEHPEYWNDRLRQAQNMEKLWYSVFVCPEEKWIDIERRHYEILRTHIRDDQKVLDIGCGYGRLLTFFPVKAELYLGVDLCPDMILLAQQLHPQHRFKNLDFGRDIHALPPEERADWGVCISIRPMIMRHLGEDAWQSIRRNAKGWCDQLLYLEYDTNHPGEVEVFHN